MRLALFALALAFAVTGCGGDDGPPPERTAASWVEALRARDWNRACSIQAEPRSDCARSLASQYDGRTLAVLPAGAYQSGDDVTDNRTRFALRASRQRGETLTYFVIHKADGRWAVDPLASVER